MPAVGNYSDGSNGTILPVGEHGCKLIDVRMTKGTKYGSTEEIDQWQFTFQSLKWKDAEGEPGIITQWTGLDYGNDKAKLTILLNMVFGRHLTKAEFRALDFDKMIGITGWVMVLPHTKDNGVKTSKFGAFRNPDNKPVPEPSAFAGETTAPQTAPTGRPTPKDAASLPEDDPFGDLEDPFAGEDTNGTGDEAPF